MCWLKFINDLHYTSDEIVHFYIDERYKKIKEAAYGERDRFCQQSCSDLNDNSPKRCMKHKAHLYGFPNPRYCKPKQTADGEAEFVWSYIY